jgi:GNAT superfamily N-acetyltransferase
MQTIIRKGEEKDIPAVLELIRELAHFEKAPQEVTNTEADMLQDGFTKNPAFMLHVAETDGIITGMAIYFIKYSTWKGKGVYLDDIIVKEQYRRQGIGYRLLNAVILHSHELGAKQLHWQVLDWNASAIAFYKKYNADFDNEWINCKLNEYQLELLAQKIKRNEGV